MFALETTLNHSPHTLRGTQIQNEMKEYTHKHLPILSCTRLSLFERSHSCEWSHSDSVSDLSTLPSDYADKRARRSLRGDTRGRK